MKDYFILYFFAFVVGVLLGYSTGDFEAREAIEECQKELPRNVNCKVIAVPVDKN
jgi:hypothetical protein